MEHGWHRPGRALQLSVSNVPGLHGCFVSQNGWLELSWYLPVGQSTQVPALAVPEKLPAAHGAQWRFDVAVPSVSMCVPAAHEAWSTQYVLPTPSWNWPSLHVVQLAAFSVSENVPEPHDVQLRFVIGVPSMSTCVPAAHEAWSTQ